MKRLFVPYPLANIAARPGFFQENGRLFVLVFQIGDVVAILLAGVLAFLVTFGQLTLAYQYQLTLLGVSIGAIVGCNHFDLYRPWRGTPLGAELLRLFHIWTLLCAAGILAVHLLDGWNVSIIWFTTLFLLGLAFLAGARVLLRVGLIYLRNRGITVRNVIVLGAGNLGRRVTAALRRNSWAGLRVVAYLDDKPDLIGRRIDGIPVLGALDTAKEQIDRFHDGDEAVSASGKPVLIHQVWAALPLTAGDRLRQVLATLDETPADVHIVPDIFHFRLMNHGVDQVADLPVINVSRSRIVGFSWMLKALEDKVVAGLALLVFSPLMLVIAALVKTSSPGPILFRQERMTWRGHKFDMLKFRTMPTDVESGTGPVWAKAGEDRATPIGKILRKTSLDELPQLFNVLKGDMSVVGPRPERPHFVFEFRDQIPAYMMKHVVKAGMTGWAQINGWRGGTTEDLQGRIEHDLYYIQNWSLWFDIKILWYTVFRGFTDKNAY